MIEAFGPVLASSDMEIALAVFESICSWETVMELI